MKRHMLFLLVALFALTWGIDRSWAQAPGNGSEMKYRGGKLTTAERNAAAKRARAQGLMPGVAGLNTDPNQDTEPVRKKRERSRHQIQDGESMRKK